MTHSNPSEGQQGNWRQGGGSASQGGSSSPTGRPPESPAGEARRFRGGKRSVRDLEPGAHRWYRVFLPVVAFAVVLVLLVTTLTLPFLFPAAPKPKLVAWAVTNFQSPVLPLNDFALEDVTLLRKSTLVDTTDVPDGKNLQIRAGFDMFFSERLPLLEVDTLIVYLSAHGASTSNAGFVLHAGSTPDPSSGYPIATILEKLAECPARRKLLILDTTRIEHSLEMGMLGNDFVHHLKQVFREVTKKLERRRDESSLWILCSSDDGQAALVTPGLGHSAFGLAVAYALHGGTDVDRAPAPGTPPDGVITAAELTRYVREQVSGWAAARHRANQTPIVLSFGDDFPVVRVHEGTLTAAEFLAGLNTEVTKESNGVQAAAPTEPTGGEASAPGAPKEPATAEGEVGSEKAKVAAKAGPASAAESGKDVKPEATTPLSADSVRQQIIEAWMRGGKLAKSPAIAIDPVLWCEWILEMRRCEHLLLAEQFDSANRLLSETIPKIEKSLVDLRPLPLPAWTVTMANPDDKEDPLAAAEVKMLALLEQPVGEKIEEMSSNHTVEADLLRLLNSRFRRGEGWVDPALAKLAWQVRARNERVVRIPSAILLPLVQPAIEAAEARRRLGDSLLIATRVPEAEDAYRQAEQFFARAENQMHQADLAWTQVARTTAELPFYLDWLAAIRPNREDLPRFREHWNELIVRLSNFATKPSLDTLERAAAQARGLEELAESFAENAWQHEARDVTTALHLPALSVALRGRLLRRAAQAEEPTPITAVPQDHGYLDSEAIPASPYSLDSLATFLGNKDKRFSDDLQRLEPGGTERLTLADIEKDSQSRALRATVGERLRRFLGETIQPPAVALEGNSVAAEIGADLRLRAVAKFDALASSGFGPSPKWLTRRERDLARQSRYHVDRLALDNLALNQPVYLQSQNHLIDQIRSRQIDPRLILPILAPLVSLESDRDRTLLAGTTEAISMKLAASQELPQAVLSLSWKSQPNCLSVSLGDRKSAEGMIELPIEWVETTAGWVAELTPRFVASAEVESPLEVPLSTWVRYGEDQVQWLPLQLRIQPRRRRPAELELEWGGNQLARGSGVGGTESERRTEEILPILPNQSQSLAVAVVKNDETPLEAMLEWHTGGTRIATVPVAMPAEKRERLVIAPPQAAQAKVRDGKLTLKLTAGGELLDERILAIQVLAPNQFTRCEAHFDPLNRQVQAQVTRTADLPNSGPIPIYIDLPGLPVTQGNRASVLDAENVTATASVLAPPSVGDEDFVAAIDVAGVPRAYRFLLSGRNARGEADTRLRLAIAAPEPLSHFVFQPDHAPLQVTLRADGPADLLGIEVGIDADGNGELDRSEIQWEERFDSGRAVNVEWSASLEPPSFLLSARVGDVTLPLRVKGLVGRQSILARLRHADVTRGDRVEVFFLAKPPELEWVSPGVGELVAAGKPLTVAVRAKDRELRESIDSIEFGIDINGNGRWEEAETIAPAGPPLAGRPFASGRDHFEVTLPTEKLSEGPIRLMARARSGLAELPPIAPGEPPPAPEWTGPPTIREIRLGEVRPQSTTPVRGTIAGQVLFGMRGQAGVRVQLVELGQSATTDFQGNFVFDDLEPGDYTIQAKQGARADQAKVTVPKGETVRATLSLKLQ